MELMIAVGIVSILLAVALPSFNSSQRKSRRTDAFAALTSAQQAQERWRSNNASYGASADVGLPLTTPGTGYYTVDLVASSNTATGYIITATAVSGKSQANDTGCQTLGVKMDSGNLYYGSTASDTIDWTDANKCWAK